MRFKKTVAGLSLAGTLAAGGTVAVDQTVFNPYDTVDQTFQIAEASTLPEAGNNKVILDKTKPKMTLEKWNGEVAMGVTYDGMQATGDKQFLSTNVQWKQGDQTMEVVLLEKSPTLEDGRYEINILLDSKPASNVFNFSIDGADNLDFFYQPALTDEEIKEGASRPDNVVGSYAVYYKDHANHKVGETNYATGKAYHIFRPLVTDADGVERWAELSYSEGILTVTVPQDFLDNAVYPVKVDPTFGYTTIGASTVQNFGADFTRGLLGTGANGTVDSFSVYASRNGASNYNTKVALWLASDRSLVSPQSDQVSINSGTAQWWTYTITGTLSITAQDYIIGNFIDGGSSGDAVVSYFDTGGPANTSGADNTGTYPTFVNPVAALNGTSKRSQYATYTASGGASAAPQDDGQWFQIFE